MAGWYQHDTCSGPGPYVIAPKQNGSALEPWTFCLAVRVRVCVERRVCTRAVDMLWPSMIALAGNTGGFG